MKSNDFFILGNGIKIPAIGFGTWQIPNGKVAYNSVSFALKSGYRHIDTANAYGNEESVGKAVFDSGIARGEIFVTSKLPAEIKDHDNALRTFEKTMKNIGLDYIDLYLIHAPWPWGRMGADYTKENIEVWKAMEKIYEGGRCRAIGVSNFNVSDLTAIIKNSNISPMANQIKFYIGHIQEEITRFCRENNILVEGYSPFATGAILENETIAEITRRYNVTVPRICVRYVLQKEVLPLPKSTHPEFIRQNADVDFEISDADMKYLDSLKNTTRFRFGL
jgi:diketogulonate reductase-like aldo/keto reductase